MRPRRSRAWRSSATVWSSSLPNLDTAARAATEQASQEQLALTREIEDLQAELATVTNARWAAETSLTAATSDIASLEAERDNLEQTARRPRPGGASGGSSKPASSKGRSIVRSRVFRPSSTGVREARGQAEAALATAEADLESLQAERLDLEQQLAALDSEARQAARAGQARSSWP